MTCWDCGVSLPVRPPGRRGAPPRRCAACLRKRLRLQSRQSIRRRYKCRCGRPRAIMAKQCKVCHEAGRRGPDLHCEHCGAAFWRSRSWLISDARRFCSKKCSGARRTAHITTERQARRLARQQELARRPCEICLLPLGPSAPERRTHTACQREIHNWQAREHVRLTRAQTPSDHRCPGCGQIFCDSYTDKRRVYCSPRCCRAVRRMKLGGLRKIPNMERNALARLVALAKLAQRVMHDERTGEDTAKRSIAIWGDITRSESTGGKG